MRATRWMLGALLVLGTGVSHAAMVAKPVSWTQDGTTFDSVLVYDDAVTTKRPGLVMVPNWYGVNDMAIAKAKMIAGKDYVILLTDMYGKGVRPTTDEAAGAAAKPLYANRSIIVKRVVLALDQLKAQAGKAPIDLSKLGAIGFCFGGTVVLDLARSGADIASVVTFHGILSPNQQTADAPIKAKVLVLNGADDTSVPAEQKQGFEQEMREGKVDWTLVDFGNTVHCFTEKEAAGKPGNCRYDERSAARGYAAMHAFLAAGFAGH